MSSLFLVNVVVFVIGVEPLFIPSNCLFDAVAARGLEVEARLPV